MLCGHQTWVFSTRPAILASAAVGGPLEAKGPLANDFDLLHGERTLGQESWEKSEKKLLEEACDKALEKAQLEKGQVQFFISGDLNNQIIASSYSARTLEIPFIGVFGACSTSMESLAMAALLTHCGAAKYAMAATSSHNSVAEKQYRNPTEYGSQKPPSAQWTVTGAGAAIVGHGSGVRIAAATIGRVVDMGVTDPFNMGAAMAPAAIDTIEAHMRDLAIQPTEYDAIFTGDLGRVGASILIDVMKDHGFTSIESRYHDCGVMIYGNDLPQTLSGGSGCACSATVVYGHILKRMHRGDWKKVLIVATGALHSPVANQQGETIPSIAHAVALESE